MLAWVVPTLGLVGTFFALLLVFVASPFATQAALADGAGLNPSLQNPYMAIHPPMLYLGYVGLTVPFAFAMGALLSGRTDERWIVATRRWTLAAWAFLGVGQLLGAHWAYVEIGWGGFYAWDPVENAALMPWLAATAFLHSVMIQEKRGMLKVWNVLLIVLACSTLPAGSSAQTEPTVVEVNNQSFLDMTVYAVRSSQRVRLGLATANSTTRFNLPSSLVGGLSTLRFVADPIGSNRASVSQEITIAPGDTVAMKSRTWSANGAPPACSMTAPSENSIGVAKRRPAPTSVATCSPTVASRDSAALCVTR